MATTTAESTRSALPMDIQQKLQELELELAEGWIFRSRCFSWPLLTFVALGDITQKGFEKKRLKLLAPYQQQSSKSNENSTMDERSHTFLSLKMILKLVTTRITIIITIIIISFILKNRRIGHRNSNVDVRNEMATIDTIQVGVVCPSSNSIGILSA